MQTREVAMLPGDRLDFQVGMRFFKCVGQVAQRTPRARAGGEFCIEQTRTVAMIPWKLKGRLTVADWFCKVTCVCQMSVRRRSARCARARVGRSALRRLAKSPCSPGNSSGPVALAELISNLTCVFQMSARLRSARRACDARAGG